MVVNYEESLFGTGIALF